MTIKIHSPSPSAIHHAALATLLLISLPLSASADTLTVTVNNIKQAGEIHVAVYDNAGAFDADRGERGAATPGITEGTREMVERGSMSYVYELPPGNYAISIFHDVNWNNNFFGVPKEQFSLSNHTSAVFGPCDFQAAAYILNGKASQSIDSWKPIDRKTTDVADLASEGRRPA